MASKVSRIDYGNLTLRKDEFRIKLSNCFDHLQELGDMDLSNANKLISESLLTTAADIGGTKKHNQQKLSIVTKEMMSK